MIDYVNLKDRKQIRVERWQRRFGIVVRAAITWALVFCCVITLLIAATSSHVWGA